MVLIHITASTHYVERGLGSCRSGISRENAHTGAAKPPTAAAERRHASRLGRVKAGSWHLRNTSKCSGSYFEAGGGSKRAAFDVRYAPGLGVCWRVDSVLRVAGLCIARGTEETA